MSISQWPRLTGVLAIALSATALSTGAGAADTSLGRFDVTAGLGAAMRPTYLGSDRYQATLFPLVSVNWNDMVSLGQDGLRVYWRGGGLTAGAGLTFDGGRKEKDANTLGFGNGDSRLAGLGEIDASLGYQAFLGYRLGMVELNTSVVKYDGKQNDGLVVRFGAAVPIKLTNRLTLTPHAESQWANNSYMQTFFGVTPAQALRSRFTAFEAKSGISNVSAGLKATYAFNAHWFAMADASANLLAGDARKSPITYSDTAATVATAIGYRF